MWEKQDYIGEKQKPQYCCWKKLESIQRKTECQKVLDAHYTRQAHWSLNGQIDLLSLSLFC